MHQVLTTLLICLLVEQSLEDGNSFKCEGVVQLPQPVNDTTPPGTHLFSIEGLKNFSYCSLKEYFEIQNTTVVLNKSLTDYCGDVSCAVECRAGDSQAKPQNISVILTIDRLGNYSIQFERTVYRLNVTENVRNGTNIVQQGFETSIKECRMGDLGTGFVRLFTLINDTEGLFVWGPSTKNNILMVNKKIDYECHQSMNLTLQVTFQKNSGKMFSIATTNLEISMIDMDDNPPKFFFDDYTVDIPEENTTIVNKTLSIQPEAIYAYDMDKGIKEEIVYSILEEGTPFIINSSTGEVHVTEALDRESKGQWDLTIKASQKARSYLMDTAVLRITVKDIDDNSPKFEPENYTAQLLEHSSQGSYITAVKATDKDLGENAKFSFKLANDSLPVFVDDNGVLRVGSENDFDREKYGDTILIKIFTVTHDNRTGNNTCTVTVHLEDINDQNPEFSDDSYHFTVDDTNAPSVIGNVAATDKDTGPNANVTFSVVAGTDTQVGCEVGYTRFPFTIDALSGNVSLNLLTTQLCSEYRVIIKGCDNPVIQSSRRCSVAEVFITSPNSTNETDISHMNQTFDMIENSGVDTIVGKLNCIGYEYRYSGDMSFVINKLGLLKTSIALDREDKDKHEASITVEDSHKNVVCIVNVTINVIDANDNMPVFDKEEYSFELPDAATPVLEVGIVRATDVDQGANGDVSYSLKSVGDFNIFSVNKTSGTVFLHADSIPSKDIFRLLVAAIDNGTQSLESVASVIITRPGIDNFTIPLSSPITATEVHRRKQRLEKTVAPKANASELSLILKLNITIWTVLPTNSNDQKIKSIIYIAGNSNDSMNVTKSELQRNLLANYEAVRALLYQDLPDGSTTASEKGLRAPEIALIIMAAIILIGAVISIVVISKQFNSHKKYRRLYENLTRNSSIYESQEIKVNMDDETSDYCGSLTTHDLESTESKVPDTSVSCSNPSFRPVVSENDSGNVSVSGRNIEVDAFSVSRPRSDSEQALESLSKLNDMLEKEVGEEGSKSGNMILNCDLVEVINRQQMPAETDVVDDVKHIEDESQSNVNAHIQKGDNVAQTNDDNHANDTKEPNPDYDIKQVRFSTEVLDTDDNRFEPLKENEGCEKLSKLIASGKEKQEGVSDDEMTNEVFAEGILETRHVETEENDETGWVEEEINSPNTSVSLDDEDNNEHGLTKEVSTHF